MCERERVVYCMVVIAILCVHAEVDVYYQRGNLANSYIAFMIDFVHPTTFELCKMLCGMLSLQDRRHDAGSLAVLVARRIERLTNDKQLLALGVSDSGGNVYNAIQQCLHTYDKLLEMKDADCLSLFAPGRRPILTIFSTFENDYRIEDLCQSASYSS